jgi:cation diffusion facilitator family transporter
VNPAAPASDLEARARLGVAAAQTGLLANTVLAMVKLVAGLVGNSYALVADAVESLADVVSSLIVWGGLRVSVRRADASYPFGYGKAEPLAAAVVGLMLLGAAVGIASQAVEEIVTPHHGPAPFTLVVLVGVVVTKELLARRVARTATAVGSGAVEADAWHHRSDALTSAAAAVGITIGLVGGPRFAPADDWAALVASLVILWNGQRILRGAVADLMDRSPGQDLHAQVATVAAAEPGVMAIEKLLLRRSGLGAFVEIHVESDPQMSLREAHALSGRVKAAIRARLPQIVGVVVHMEPFEPGPAEPRPR